MADMTTRLEFDPGRPEVRADPYALFRELRRHDPVHWSPALGAWVLTRYDDVKGAVNDPRFSADRISPFRDSLAGDARERIAGLLAVLGDWMVFNDPPRHTRLRALVGKVFTPRVGERLRSLARTSRCSLRTIPRTCGKKRLSWPSRRREPWTRG